MTGPVRNGQVPGDAQEVHTTDLVLSDVDRAQIDIQIATAKRYPRMISDCLKNAVALATMNEEIAKSMFYTLPKRKNGDKLIQGPSVRMAEIIAHTWKNLRIDSGVLSVDAKAVTSQATCFDLEANVAVRVAVPRRITTTSGQRYGDDMIQVTALAAVSLALRNAVFRVVPMVYVEQVYEAAKKAAMGEASTWATKRHNAVGWFVKAGITKEQVLAFLEISDIDDIGPDQYATLVGLSNSIKNGDTKLEEAFPKESGAERINRTLREQQTAAGQATATDAPATESATQTESDEQRLAREDAEMVAREAKK